MTGKEKTLKLWPRAHAEHIGPGRGWRVLANRSPACREIVLSEFKGRMPAGVVKRPYHARAQDAWDFAAHCGPVPPWLKTKKARRG
jgi:hypothetical protein